jgi:hypothetical protein
MNECSNCGTALADCDRVLRERGRGCCAGCFLGDTHGLVAPSDDRPLSERVTALESWAEDVTAALELLQGEVAHFAEFRAALDRMSKLIAQNKGGSS